MKHSLNITPKKHGISYITNILNNICIEKTINPGWYYTTDNDNNDVIRFIINSNYTYFKSILIEKFGLKENEDFTKESGFIIEYTLSGQYENQNKKFYFLEINKCGIKKLGNILNNNIAEVCNGQKLNLNFREL